MFSLTDDDDVDVDGFAQTEITWPAITQQNRDVAALCLHDAAALFVFFSLSVSEVRRKKEKARHISRAWLRSKQREEVLQVANLESSASLGILGLKG